MSTKTSVILLWLVLIQEGAAIRPVVTFTPNYKKIFSRESITMTCDVDSSFLLWYKDNFLENNGKSYTIQNAGISDSGSYQCHVMPGERSDPVRLDVSDGYVILQTPLYVYEGDEITIRCHHPHGHSGRQSIFYKDYRIIRDWTDNSEFYIRNVDRKTAGTYKCKKEVNNYGWNEYEDEVFVFVEELFLTPTIKVTPQPVIQMDYMILKCETRLHPSRQNIQLQFTFYREGRIVKGFDLNNIYEVYNVQQEDSGKYSCEVESTDGRVRKQSAEQIIYIEELFTTPTIKVTPDLVSVEDRMTLKCETSLHPSRQNTQLRFTFYREGQMVQESFSSALKVNIVQDSGKYSCEVSTLDGSRIKRSAEKLIQIEGHTDNIGYTHQNIFRLILSGCVLIIAAIFVFRHVKWMKSMGPEDHSTT